MAQNDQKLPQKRVETPLWPSGPTYFDPTPHFTPTLGGPDTLGAFAHHPNGQKGSKKTQKGPKWLKMTKNDPQKGSGRHVGPRHWPISTPRLILCGVRTHLEPLPPPQRAKKGKNGPKGPKMAQNGQKWPQNRV